MMQPQEDLAVPRPPTLASLFIGNDRNFSRLLRSVDGYLSLLHRGAQDVVSAICLFDYCKLHTQGGDLYSRWHFTAARDGAMALHNMALGLRYLRTLSGTLERFRHQIDFDRLKEAQLFFQDRFPNVEKLRHAIAHQEHYSNPNKPTMVNEGYEDRNVSFPKSTVISQLLSDDAFISSFDGDTVQYSLNYQTARDVVDTCKTAFSAYDRIEQIIDL